MIETGQVARPHAMNQRAEGKGVQLWAQRCILSRHVEKCFRRKVDGVSFQIPLVLGWVILEKAAVQINQTDAVTGRSLEQQHVVGLEVRVHHALRMQALQTQRKVRKHLPLGTLIQCRRIARRQVGRKHRFAGGIVAPLEAEEIQHRHQRIPDHAGQRRIETLLLPLKGLAALALALAQRR